LSVLEALASAGGRGAARPLRQLFGLRPVFCKLMLTLLRWSSNRKGRLRGPVYPLAGHYR